MRNDFSRQLDLEFLGRPVNFPTDTERLSIVGTTGSGKTHAALWHLAMRNYDVKPWVVYDFKYDEFIGSIPGTFELDVNAPAPEHPGLYVVHPIPEDDDDAVEDQMTDIWKRENIGVFVDEGYMLSNRNKGFRKLLTQGRSKHIPMIVCTQRPVWIDKFVFTESEYKQVFRLQNREDQKKVEEYVPYELYRLEKRWSWYYDSPSDQLTKLRPVPDQRAIRAMFEAKLARLRKVV